MESHKVSCCQKPKTLFTANPAIKGKGKAAWRGLMTAKATTESQKKIPDTSTSPALPWQLRWVFYNLQHSV